MRVLELQIALLRRAAEIAGGRVALCEYLGVSDSRFEQWVAGRFRLPDPIFLRAVDLILRDDVARALADRRKQLRDRSIRQAEFPYGSASL